MIKTSSQGILMTDSIAGGGIFHRGKVNVTPARQKQCSHADLIAEFLLHTIHRSSYSHLLFNGPDNPQKLPLLLGGFKSPSNMWFLGHTRVTHPYGISIGSAIFAGFKNVTNRQTETDRTFGVGTTVKMLYARGNY